MKKFLSLVLALVMTMSLVTISAGADYTDADKVNYDEAIDVMSTIGVISGYEDGSINPQGSLTRGAAAKIICNLVLGPTDAAALKVTEAPYKDVPANSTFAGYISYCKSAGYVSGYADGTFKPGATLTGYAFMKMLLGTLGLDKNIEGYEGTNWSVNVAKRALKLDLAAGLNGSFNGTKGINREEAMLFAFNTLQKQVFTYDTKGSSITVGGVAITTGASEATQNPVGGPNNTLMVELFGTDLQKVDAEDDFKRPATTWYFKSKKIDTYAKAAKLTYTTDVKEEKVYEDLDLAATGTFAYYQNGTLKSAAGTIADVDQTVAYTGRGIVTEVFYSWNGVKEIVSVPSRFAKVTDVTKNSDGKRVVIIDGKEFKTDDFAKGDYVVFTATTNADDTTKSVKSAYAVEKQTGTITKKVTANGSTTYYIDGTAYETNQSPNFIDHTGMSFAGNVKDVVEFYVDQYGYLVYMKVKSSTASVDNLGFVTAGDSQKGTGWVKMYKASGTAAEVVDITKEQGSNYVDKLVKYTMDGEKYALETVGNYYNKTSLGSNYTFTKGSTTITDNSTGVAADFGVTLDAKTAVMVINAKGDVVSSTVGIKNTATVSAFSKLAIYEESGIAKLIVIFAEDNQVVTNSSALTFVLWNKDAPTIDMGDSKSYATYTTINKGVTADKDFASMDWGTAPYDNYIAVLKNYTVNSDGYISGQTLAIEGYPSNDYVRATAVSAVENGVVALDGVSYAVADNCKVITISKAGVIDLDAGLDAVIEQSVTNPVHFYDVVATWNTDKEIEQIILCAKH